VKEGRSLRKEKGRSEGKEDLEDRKLRKKGRFGG
jgi:hypothetical protein